MRSKEEADKIAETLLEAERRKAKRPPRVPFPFRTAASQHLEPAEEWQLFREARDRVKGNWPAAFAVVAAPVALMFSFALFLRHPLTGKYVLALDAALLVPPALVMFHIRRELARLIHERRDPPL
ncbi:MAG: hypothetical protein ACREUT_14770 [Steroidobacteraceae bacterium]